MRHKLYLMVIFLLLVVSISPRVMTTQKQPVPTCPFVYKELEEDWGALRIEDIPDQLVHEYAQKGCRLWEAVQTEDALSIQNAQKAYVEVVGRVNAYMLAYLPIFVADVETIQLWLEMRSIASVVPENYSIYKNELDCPQDPSVQEIDAVCDQALVLTTDTFEGSVDFWGTRFIQDFEGFTLYRTCEVPITVDTIEDAFSCPVLWITQKDPELGYRGLTGLAILSLDWHPPSRYRPSPIY